MIRRTHWGHGRRRFIFGVGLTVSVTWFILTYFYINQLPSKASSTSFSLDQCEQLFQNRSSVSSYTTAMPSDYQLEMSCEAITTFSGQTPWISPEEANFPIAYAISVYQSPVQLARFLRLIYRPHNAYCVHIDRKTAKHVADEMERIVRCFGPNMLIVPVERRFDVAWGYLSVLESSLVCAEMLLTDSSVKWRYFLNANNKEFPLRTNWEIVAALKALNGSNMVENVHSADMEYRIPRKNYSFEFTWYKGSFLTALRREFVQFIFTDPRAIEIVDSMKAERHLKKVQDELLFSTLAFNPHLGAPGACLKQHPVNQSDPRSWFLARYVNWDKDHCPSGYAVHGVCILGVRDLPILIRQPHLLANKFFENFQPIAYTCMEYWLVQRLQYEKTFRKLHPSFDVNLFADLYCSKEHI